MVNIDDYREEKTCIYKGEEYLVRDNGAVLRKSRPNKRTRKHDNEWTFGTMNYENGYGFFFGSGHRIHQIVATAFWGERPSNEHIVDHIDTNKQNNRPDNLRWVTKEENILNNPFTCKKIEHITGVSVEEFIKNPEKYRDCFERQNVSYMRPVTKAEAVAFSKNMERLGTAKRPPINKNPSNLKNWVYKIRDPYVDMWDLNTKYNVKISSK